jgi:hypothetical protein
VQFLTLAGYNVSRDLDGVYSTAGAGRAFEDLAEYDFNGPAPTLPAGLPAPHFQKQLLKFVAPLLSRPLRSAVHEENLRAYQASR